MTDHDPPTTDPERTRSTARGAELRSELAITDARRAEEETAKAHEAVEEATAQERKRAAKEQEAKQRAKAAEEQAERARTQARETAPGTAPAASRGTTAGAVAATPPAASSSAMDRPEVRSGAAFAGAFLLARILKRLVD